LGWVTLEMFIPHGSGLTGVTDQVTVHYSYSDVFQVNSLH